MITTPEILKGKKFPRFIRRHLIFKAYEPEKIFPKMGLTNCTETVKPADKEELKKTALTAVATLRKEVLRRRHRLFNTSTQEYVGYNYYNNYGYRDRPKSWKDKKSATLRVLSALSKEMRLNPESFIEIKRNKITFKLPKKIGTGDLALVKGRDIFRELSRLNRSTRVKDFPSFKMNRTILSKVLGEPIKDSKIVFSSDGKQGLWDIATMSMRGITSCQRWSSSHAECLIGSMIDPYTAVLYLQKGKTKYGSRMTKRAVVRLVLSRTQHKPAILIERIYPYDYNNGSRDHATLSIFTSFLKEKTKNKYPIVYGETAEARKYFIPLSEQVESLNQDERSYRDSHIGYHEVNRDIESYLK